MALRAVGLRHAYTNGTGGNQVISNADLTQNCGEASNLAQQMFTALIRAFDYLPPVDVTFEDLLRSLPKHN